MFKLGGDIMAHLLAQILRTPVREYNAIEELCKQYDLLQPLYLRVKLSKVKTFEDLNELVNQVTDDFTVIKLDKDYNPEFIKNLFIDLIKILERLEFKELKDTVKTYTNNSFIIFFNSADILSKDLINIISDYLEDLEKTYETLRYDEKLVVKKYYYLKVKLIDTFIWVGGLNNG